ncbi:MAG TPA: type III-B CRISPR module-associated protein Cmr3 [Thermoanaerobacterales bacterium]|nr:type III-B CRISPR module-associated protein Cmr3 [Thermoanaerobacterales bacterium]
MFIKIEALDTLFFRDGKPFTMGSETWANGIFPPPPSVIYGALRSAYFAENIGELPKAKTKEDPTANLKIKGMFLSIGGSIYYPLPLDCVKEKNNSEDKCAFMLSLDENNVISSCVTQMLLKSPDNIEVETVEGGVLDHLCFEDYLSLRRKNFFYKEISEYVLLEPKIGIGRNKQTLTTDPENGRLYRVGMNRLASRMKTDRETETLSLVVDFTRLKLPESGFLRLGGEGKAAFYSQIQDLDIAKPAGLKGMRFKLVLTTPAIFEHGWLPRWLDNEKLEGEYEGIRLKLLTAVVGKYLTIGGFDIKDKQPKPMWRAVPPGSVYYFELCDEGDIAEVVNVFNYKSISDYSPEEGYGIAFVGGVEN